MKSKTPKGNPIGWVWIEMRGFKSKEERLECLQLLKAGYTHPFKRFLLRVAYDKIWFRVRQRDKNNVAWLNGAFPNHCTRVLGWLSDSKRHDEEFRRSMGWPTEAGERLLDEPTGTSPTDSAEIARPSSRVPALGALAQWRISACRR